LGYIEKFFKRTPKPGQVQPVTDSDFQDKVLTTSKRAIVQFHSTTCGPCQVMGGLMNELGPQYVGQVDFFKVNVNDSPATAHRFEIMSVPTLILFKDGAPVDSAIGLIPLNPLKEKLDKLSQA
jgi:thioredoxin 1